MVFAIAGGGQLGVANYQIDNSVMFSATDTAYMSRTPSSTGNRQKFTWSGWLKLGTKLTTENKVFGAADTSNPTYIQFTDNTTSALTVAKWTGSSHAFRLTTTRLFRDTAAWYHIVIAFDTTQATASNRIKIYVNGEQVTDFGTASYPSQNYSTDINHTEPHYLGLTSNNTSNPFDGYMAEVQLVDGQQLDASSFGETDEDSGIWKPIAYTGSYGTNGFYLDFGNSGSLGADQSGNGNSFTTTNFASTDQTPDTPTNHFCTWNYRGDTASHGNFIHGMLQYSGQNTNAIWQGSHGFRSGKWYWEHKNGSGSGYPSIGILSDKHHGELSQTFFAWRVWLQTGNIYNEAGSVGSLGAFSNTDILMVAVDADNGKVWFGKNGSWWNSGNPASGTTPAYSNLPTSGFQHITPALQQYRSGSTNFGYPPPGFSIASGNSDANGYGNFEYAPPSGFYALCSANLAEFATPDIDKPTDYFNTVLYSGNAGTNRSITGMGFQPDFLWHKERSSIRNYSLVNSSTGTNASLQSNSAAAESTMPSFVSFDSDGFTVTQNGSTNPNWNESGVTKVVWGWKINGGSTSTNTNGTISTTVQANQDLGISILTYTGTQANATIGHGLSKAPEVMIAKIRNEGTYGWGGNWWTFRNTGQFQINTQSSYYENAVYWQNTDPSNTVITMGGQVEANRSGKNMIAWCFHSVEGFSKMGVYKGNGNNLGKFVYTGFKPAFVFLKRATNTSNFVLWDGVRNTYNQGNFQLFSNSSEAEDNTGAFDFLSNGFRLRNTNATWNANGDEYVYMAFAENPIVSSTGVVGGAR
jgi:hypothetical protein